MRCFKTKTLFLGFVAVAVQFGCGPHETQNADPDGMPEPVCLSCDTDLTSPTPVTPLTYEDVRAVPDALAFYGDLGSSHALPPKDIAIVNRTQVDVVLNATYIAPWESSMFGRDAAPYFAVSNAGGMVLHPGQSVTITVAFRASSETREALLVIETNHPEFSSLVVPLSGKYFTSVTSF